MSLAFVTTYGMTMLNSNYCSENTNIFGVWINKFLISQYFLDVITTLILAVYLLVFGSRFTRMCEKYGVIRPAANFSNLNSILYRVQIFLTYFLTAISVFQFVTEIPIWSNQQVNLHTLISNFIHALSFKYCTTLIGLGRDYILPSTGTLMSRGCSLTLLVFWILLFAVENTLAVNFWKSYRIMAEVDNVTILFLLTRYFVCAVLLVLELQIQFSITALRKRLWSTKPHSNLLSKEHTETKDQEKSTWRDMWAKIKFVAPYFWPKNDFSAQKDIFIWAGLLIIDRAINTFLPIYSKKIVDSISISPIEFRWDYLVTFALMKFVRDQLCYMLQSVFRRKVIQHMKIAVKTDMFRHLHSLSFRWHLNRKTGEVLHLMDRGTGSITGLIQFMMPMIFDISIANFCFAFMLGWRFATIIFSATVLYVGVTILITEYCANSNHREMNSYDDQMGNKCVDSLLNYETVKYFGNEKYEVDMYTKALLDNKDKVQQSMVSYDLRSVAQSSIMDLALLCGSLLCVYDITVHKTLSVGDYVLYTTYLSELLIPLQTLGYCYSAVQKAIIDIESMYDLLSEKPDVQDLPDAQPIQVKEGSIEFRNVCFSYMAERPVLKDISFKVQPGKILALVGPSGGGKTTIVRLIFRFYEVDSGSILIDDQNIKNVTQESLRKLIGVVPQDTVLFNETIRYNIQYGRVDACESDVVEASKCADIHERILTFPDAYNTKVGERGLKLSGGEKQRIAIARTFLKSPKILLLDEATSSLDTLSERNIQSSLTNVCKGRTTIVVAHRLSTIIHADEILVVKDGQICERGTHKELVSQNGVYATMWKEQLDGDEIIKIKS